MVDRRKNSAGRRSCDTVVEVMFQESYTQSMIELGEHIIDLAKRGEIHGAGVTLLKRGGKSGHIVGGLARENPEMLIGPMRQIEFDILRRRKR